ncbi:ABC transporter permease [Bacteroidota bacterium]
MIKNYFTTAIRNIFKNPSFSFINILGLSIGIASSILILLWVQNELSYDKFHKGHKNIYKIISYGQRYMIEGYDGGPGQLGPAIKDEIPEIKNIVRINQIFGGAEFKYDNHIYIENNGIIVDSTFFDVFTFPFVSGNKESALSEPYNIVITKKMALKYFGQEEALGKIINYGDNALTVTGVIQNPPDNSHIKFDFLVPTDLYLAIGGKFYWGMFMTTTFMSLTDNINEQKLNNQITEIAKNNNCPQVVSDGIVFRICPLTDIHLGNIKATDHYYTDVGSKKVVYIFSAIAFFILLIACINYINLSTARSEKRSKEVGIRKVVGARRPQLVGQFLGESLLISFIALDLAILLVEIFLPMFNNLTGKHLNMNIFGDPQTILGLVGILVITGLLAGSYPAGFLSSFKAVNILRSNLSLKSKKGFSWLRTGLVIFQFSISIILICATSIVYKQLIFMKNRDLGFNKENVIQIPLKGNIGSKYDIVKESLLKNSFISYVSSQDASWYSGSNRCAGCLVWEGKDPEFELDMLFPSVGFDLFEMLEIKLIEGRFFSRDYETDSDKAFILNEEAVKMMNITDPIGKWCKLGGFSDNVISGEIIGVIKNINYSALHKKVEPQAYRILKNPESTSNRGVMLVKFKDGYSAQTLSAINDVWKDINPEMDPDEFTDLNASYENLYASEKNLSKILTYFTLLAVFISCLGLYGLASFMAERRTKEIGVRKVNGASTGSIIILLSRNFSKWVILSFIIACPLVWHFMNKWLQEFDYKTSITWWIFAGAGLLTVLISFITISYQSIKIANSNPADSLRYD